MACPLKRGGEARFYCEAGPGVGLGHMARCLALAEALAADGLTPVFVTGEAGRVALEWMGPGSYAYESSGDAPEARSAIAVFDNYRLEPSRMAALTSAADTSILFDDVGMEAPPAGIVVNAVGRGPSADPEGCIGLFGLAYAALRNEFRTARKAALRARDKRAGTAGSVLVTAGGQDGRGLAPVFLRAVLDSSGLAARSIDVALGSGATSWPDIKAIAADASSTVRLHSDAPDMTELYMTADASVGPGGVALLEKLCLGLPSLAVIVAENQRAIVAELAANESVLALDVTAEPEMAAAIAKSVAALLEDDARRAALGRRGATLIDGLGARRIALTAVPETDKRGGAVTLRPYTMEDADMLLAWQSEPCARAHFRDPAVPDRATHLAWSHACISDPDRVCEIVLVDGRPVGLVRLDPADDDAGNAGEVSILISGSARGRGAGTAALRALRRLLRDVNMWAEIHPDNAVSWASFRGAGFTAVRADRAEAAAVETAADEPSPH